MKKVMVVATVVLFGAAGASWAQTAGQTPGSTRQPATQGTPGTTRPAGPTAGASSKAASTSKSADEKFIMDAAHGGMAEVELGKLAAEKASSPEVKQFGQKMADDHGKANDELKSLAQSKNITLPSAVTAKDKAEHDRLSKLSGAAFDKAYMSAMLSDHRKDVNEFKRESQSGKDPEVKAWAAKTLPTLEDHLKMAQTTDKAVATSGSKKAQPKATSGTKSAPGSNGTPTPNGK